MHVHEVSFISGIIGRWQCERKMELDRKERDRETGWIKHYHWDKIAKGINDESGTLQK